MKSFLLVRSQSQISTDNRLSLSASFSWLEERKRKRDGFILEAMATLPRPSALRKNVDAKQRGALR